MSAPYASRASCSSVSSEVTVEAAGPGAGATTPDSGEGMTFSAAGGGEGGAAVFFESRDPTRSLGLNFWRMDSLWYFQNCLEASLPATRVRTIVRG